MSKYWIKVWVEILKDEKVGDLPDNLWRRMLECFLMAGLVDAGGRLPSLAKMAWITHKPEETLTKELEHLQEIGIIGQKQDKTYYVVNWEKRQARASAAQRKRKQRERERGQRHGDVTPGVTNPSRKRDQEEQRNRITTTTTALGDYVVSYLSKGQVSKATTELVQTILDTYDRADIAYAVGEAERKAATTNDPPTLEYIEAICKRRQRGEPDQPKGARNGQKRSGKSQRGATPPAQGAGSGRIEADKPAGISLD